MYTFKGKITKKAFEKKLIDKFGKISVDVVPLDTGQPGKMSLYYSNDPQIIEQAPHGIAPHLGTWQSGEGWIFGTWQSGKGWIFEYAEEYAKESTGENR